MNTNISIDIKTQKIKILNSLSFDVFLISIIAIERTHMPIIIKKSAAISKFINLVK